MDPSKTQQPIGSGTISLLLAVLLFLFPAVGFSRDGQPPIEADRFPDIIEQVKHGVVYIDVRRGSVSATDRSASVTTFFNDPEIRSFFGGDDKKAPAPQPKEQPSSAHGSGFIIDSGGHIITNSHVIDRADTVTVTLADRRQFSARIIGADRGSDIGVIKIDADPASLTPLPLGASHDLRAGQWVLAFGSPFANLQTVTAGIVSATGRNSLGISDYEDFIQTDAAINPGNSGGPLVNIDGEVIGVNAAFITQTGGYMGVGFAIPIDMVRSIAAQLTRPGTVTRAWLGVALQDATPDDLAAQNLPPDLRAARVVDVQPDSPAAAANFKEADLLVSLNDEPINGAADLRNRISLTAPGTTVTIGLYRTGTHHHTSAQLRGRP